MVSDPYMDRGAVVARLVDEWKKYGSLIVAVDYDNTIYDLHGKGYAFDRVVNVIRSSKARGAKIVIFTCCGEEKYSEIRAYLDSREIPFDAINEDLLPQPFGGRKIFYNVLLDDRAGLECAVRALATSIKILEIEEEENE